VRLAIAKRYFKAAHFIAKIYSNVVCVAKIMLCTVIYSDTGLQINQLNSIKALNRLNWKHCKQKSSW
jgi:hypothetical protein